MARQRLVAISLRENRRLIHHLDDFRVFEADSCDYLSLLSTHRNRVPVERASMVQFREWPADRFHILLRRAGVEDDDSLVAVYPAAPC